MRHLKATCRLAARLSRSAVEAFQINRTTEKAQASPGNEFPGYVESSPAGTPRRGRAGAALRESPTGDLAAVKLPCSPRIYSRAAGGQPTPATSPRVIHTSLAIPS